jgi:hypothetical protein
MATPTTRDEFTKNCLRRLGWPVINIDVSDDQLDDRVDEALEYYAQFHYNGTEKVYWSHQITPTDITNRYVTTPTNINGIVSIFSMSDPSIRADDMFNIRYQIALNDLYSLTSISMVPYYMVMQHLSLINEILVGKQPLRWNELTGVLHIDMDWHSVVVGQFILVEAYQTVSADATPKIWADRWLQKYTTALIKRQWGSNLGKFVNVQMLGGVTFNGDKIYNDAINEIETIEHEMLYSFSEPPEMMVN